MGTEVIDRETKKSLVLGKIQRLFHEGTEIGKELIKNEMKCIIDTPLDLYSQYGILRPEDDLYIDQDKDREFNEALNFIFKNFRANPSNINRTKEITDTYIKEGRISRTLTRYKCANQGGISPSFWKRIVDSLNIFKKHDPNADRDLLFTWLIGYKGCGKTTFINYFMSTKEHELNTIYRTITVRINVAYMFNNVEIQDSIKFKICKILLNYYCKDSEKALSDRTFFSLEDIENNTNISKEDLCKFYNYFTGTNKSKNSSNIIKDFLPQFNLFLKYIKNNHQYSFIIILDNIDQLGIRPDDEKCYHQRLEQITKLMVEDDQVWGIYILVMRPKTVYDIQKLSRLSLEPFSIQIPSFSAIYNSRKEYLSKTKNYGFNSNDQLQEYLDTYVRVVGSSLRNSTEYNELLDLDKALQTIEDFCTENKRLAINLMRLYGRHCLKDTTLIEYLSNVISKNNQQQDLSELLQFGYYRFFEALMLSGGYCCRFNGYDIDPNNEENLIFSNRSESPNENRFLPNLFKYPSKANTKSHFSIFVKIRILQCLKNSPITTLLSINKIAQTLNNMFGYEISVVKLACTVLLDDGCIESTSDDTGRFDVYSQNDTYIRITPRGRIILETFPEKINYLSICLEDMPLPIHSLIQERKVTFPINNYYHIDNGVCPFIIENILYTSPIIIGFLESIERKEEQLFTQSKETILKKEDFYVINRLHTNSQKILNKIIDTYLLKNDNRYSYFDKLPYEIKD